MFVLGKKPSVVAHSGCMGYPDDGLEFMKAGHTAGADGFEIDINITADHVIVLSHDSLIPDDQNKMLDISEISFKELRERKRKIVTFEEAIAEAKKYDAFMNVDIKDKSALKYAIDTMSRNGFIDRAYFTGIYYETLEKYLGENPGLITCVNIMTDANAEEEKVMEYILNCSKLGVLGINMEWICCNKKMIDFAHSLGLITSCWTLENERELQTVAAWGTDLLTTNRPDLYRV